MYLFRKEEENEITVYLNYVNFFDFSDINIC